LDTFEAKVTGELAEVKGELSSLTQWLKQSLGSPSLEQPSHSEGEKSSHNMALHSNSLPRDPRLPRVEVNKFDGSDPTGWVTQMEHYFSLHGITDDLAKLRYGVLYLDPEHWKWWQWRRKTCQGYVSWTQFVAELYDRFDTDTHYLGHLTKLKQSGTVEDFISSFEHLDFRTEGMSDAFFQECFISGLKEEIRAQVLMAHPHTWLEATQHAKEAQKIVSSQTHKPSFVPRTRPTNPAPPPTPLKIQKLTRDEMVECQLKGLCYNCDEKYFPTDITPPSDQPEVEPVISLNSLTGFSAPQTLKLIGYIKNQKVIILIDSGSTHNFIHHRISQETHCYIHAVNNFQIMIANGGSMKCGGRCENVCLQIGQYHLKSHMFSIDMGGCDIVLSVEWLHTLGPILMDFKELTMQFQ
jgi:hypothetical protein